MKVVKYIGSWKTEDPGTVGKIYCSDDVADILKTQSNQQKESRRFGICYDKDFDGFNPSIGIIETAAHPEIMEMLNASIQLYRTSPDDERHKYYVDLYKEQDSKRITSVVFDWNAIQDCVICYSFEE